MCILGSYLQPKFLTEFLFALPPICRLIAPTTKLWSESLKGIDFCWRDSHRCEDNIKVDIEECCKSKRNTFIRLRIRTSGRLL
jgi:hypothetical protein